MIDTIVIDYRVQDTQLLSTSLMKVTPCSVGG